MAVKILLWIALLFCLMVLSRYILFKKSPRYYKHYFTNEYRHYSVRKGWKQANLKPFSTIRLFSSGKVSSDYSYKNIGGNIIGFVPLGILLPLLLPFLRHFFRTTGAILFISLLFETAQLFSGTGVFDVDDLILNTAGGAAGYIIFAATAWAIRKQEREEVRVT